MAVAASSNEELADSGESGNTPEPWDDAAILKQMKAFVEAPGLKHIMRYENHLLRQLSYNLAQLRKLKRNQAAADAPIRPP